MCIYIMQVSIVPSASGYGRPALLFARAPKTRAAYPETRLNAGEGQLLASRIYSARYTGCETPRGPWCTIELSHEVVRVLMEEQSTSVTRKCTHKQKRSK